MSTLFRYDARLMSLNGLLLKMPDNYFTFNVDPTKGNGFNSFQLPFTSNSTTNCYVDFGDDTGWIHITSYNQAETLHNYPDNSIRTVKIKGEVSWSFNNAGDCQKLTYISRWGSTKFNYVANGFYGCINLTYIPQIGGIYAPNATNLTALFRGAGLTCNIPPDLIRYCVSATTCSQLFFGCAGLSGQINANLLRYSVNLVDLSFMFYSCTGLTGTIPPDLLRYVVKAQSFIQMMFNCTGLTGSIPADLLRYCVDARVLAGMLRNCTGLTGLIPADLLRYCVKVTSVSQLFYNCNGLTGFDSTLLTYLPLVTDVSYLLYGCNALNVDNFFIPLSVIPNITDFSYMMYNTTPSERFTGTVQDIWNYASPTANKLNCFTGQDLLTNYNDIPNEWKGL